MNIPSVRYTIYPINSAFAATGLQAGADAIVAYPISPTALNKVAKAACDKGVVVISYDSEMTEPCTYIVKVDAVQKGRESAQWLVDQLGGKGNIVVITGGAGTRPPIVMTLAANGILQGIALIYVDPEKGSMVGSAPRAAIWFMEGRLLGLAPVVWFLMLFVIAGSLLFTRTTFGRRLYAIGSSKVVAKLSGVRVGLTTVGVYVLSGLCSSLVGMMLIGLAKQGYRGMGDRYLLPAIAVVVVGGTLVTGGRGHYLGIFGGALLLTALDTMMSGTTWSQALRDIIFGMVVLGAIITLREKTS